LRKTKELNMEAMITIKCICGKEILLELVGGQYQDEYRGNCNCNRKWLLKELSEVLAEICDDEE
jgi:hypothetical protein